MEPIGCPETSVRDYHSKPRNIPEERGTHQHGGRNLNSEIHKVKILWYRARAGPARYYEARAADP
jgi:hypothetical protein